MYLDVVCQILKLLLLQSRYNRFYEATSACGFILCNLLVFVTVLFLCYFLPLEERFLSIKGDDGEYKKLAINIMMLIQSFVE